MNIREFKIELIELINKSMIPLDIVLLVLESVCNDIRRQVELIYATEAQMPKLSTPEPEPKKPEPEPDSKDKRG